MKNKMRMAVWLVLSVFLLAGSMGVKCFAVEDGETSKGTIIFFYCYPNGREESLSKEVSFDQNITIPSPGTETGYEFEGWFLDENHPLYESGKSYSVSDMMGNNESIKLYTSWCQTFHVYVDGQSQGYKKVTDIINIPEGGSTEKYNLAEWKLNGVSFPYDSEDAKVKLLNKENNLTTFSEDSYKTYNFSDTNNIARFTSYWKPKDSDTYLIKIHNNTGKDITINDIMIENGEISDVPIGEFINTLDIYTTDKKYKIEASLADKIKEDSSTEYVSYNGMNVECHTVKLTETDIQRSIVLLYMDFADGKDSTIYDPEIEFKRYEFTDETITIAEIGKKFISEYKISASRPETSYNFVRWRYYMQAGEELPYLLENEKSLGDYPDCARIICEPVFEGTVSYDVNYPEYTNIEDIPDNPASVNAEEGQTITLADNIKSTEEYTFIGWDTGGTVLQGGSTYQIARDQIVVKGKWEPVTYTLKWKDAVDGTIYKEEAIDFGELIQVLEMPSRTGYTFLGWDDGGSIGASGRMPAEEVVMTGSWERNSYKISYDGNGATIGVPSEEQSVSYEDVFTIVEIEPILTGHIFKGWSDGKKIYQSGEQVTMGAEDMKLIAQWEKKKYTVSYDGDGAGKGVPESREVEFGSSVTVDSSPQKNGYTFIGWEQVSTGTVIYAGGSFIMPDMDEILKARWNIAWSRISGKGSYYLIKGQAYGMDQSLKVSGDISEYMSGITFYVPESRIYTFE